MKRIYTWEEFNKDIKLVEDFAKQYINVVGLKNIYGVPRGGLVPAVVLSYRLGLPIILDKEKISRRTIIVDDIIDSGKTMVKLDGQIKGKSTFALSLFYNEGVSAYKPVFYANKKGVDEWIVFPWETEKSSKYDKTKF